MKLGDLGDKSRRGFGCFIIVKEWDVWPLRSFQAECNRSKPLTAAWLAVWQRRAGFRPAGFQQLRGAVKASKVDPGDDGRPIGPRLTWRETFSSLAPQL